MPPGNPGSLSADCHAIIDYLQDFGSLAIDGNGVPVPGCD